MYRHMNNHIHAIRKLLEAFVLKMLHLCENSKEVETFLNKDGHLCGISLEGTMLLPRIDQAMQLRFKGFVNHDYCQQVMRDTFYLDQISLKNRGDNGFFFIIQIIVQVVKTPFVSLIHSLRKVRRIFCPKVRHISTCTKRKYDIEGQDGEELQKLG